MGPDNDGEMRYKKCPRRACLWQAPASTQKTKGKLWRKDFIVLVKK